METKSVIINQLNSCLLEERDCNCLVNDFKNVSITGLITLYNFLDVEQLKITLKQHKKCFIQT